MMQKSTRCLSQREGVSVSSKKTGCESTSDTSQCDQLLGCRGFRFLDNAGAEDRVSMFLAMGTRNLWVYTV